MGGMTKNMGIKGKLILVLAFLVPLAVTLVAVVRTFQMRAVVQEIYGRGADMQGVVGDVLVSLIPTVAGVVAVALLVVFIVVRLLKPLEGLAQAAQDLAKGKTNINLKDFGDTEIGRISLGISEIAKSLNALRDDFVKGEETIGKGNITLHIKDDSLHGVFDEIITSFGNIRKEYTGFLDVLTEPVLIIDSSHKILYANNIIRRFTGTENKNVDGMHINQYVNGNIADHEYVRKTFTMGKAHVEAMVQLQLNPSQLFDLEFNCIPVHYRGRTPAIMVLMTNLTHVKNMQRLIDKRDNYRIEQFAKLTQSLTEAFSQGHLDVSIPKITDYDKDTGDIVEEFDVISDILTTSIGSINAYVNELQNTLRHMADKNFNQEIIREYTGDFCKIKDSVNIILTSMNHFIGELYGASLQIQEGAGIIANTGQEMSLSFTEQLEFVSEVNDQVHHINEEITESLQNAQMAANLSSSAKSAAQSGNVQMTNMLAAMDEIRINTDTIAGIIKTIQDIAFQTNLLALNASVEAARAGDHGRGFSVVAEAVRSLAIQAESAAVESTDVIQTSIEKVGGGVKIAKETAESLNKIVSGVESIDLIIEKIASSSTRQSTAISSIEEGMNRINQMIKEDTEVVSINATSTEELLAQSDMLKNMLTEFKLRR